MLEPKRSHQPLIIGVSVGGTLVIVLLFAVVIVFTVTRNRRLRLQPQVRSLSYSKKHWSRNTSFVSSS